MGIIAAFARKPVPYRSANRFATPVPVAPLLYAIPVQLLAYHTAAFTGTDLDQPRNLAKSVTLE